MTTTDPRVGACIESISEAKRDETRTPRVAQTMAWLAEGKPRNWKCPR